MKVLVFTSLYPNNIWPQKGVFIKERMTQFAKLEGCRIKVVAPVPYFPPIKINYRWLFSEVVRQETIEGVEVYHPRYFMTPRVGMAFYGLTMFLSVFALVRRIQRDFDFDLIDAHYVYPDAFAAVLLGRFLRKPVVVSARGSDISLYREFPLIQRLLRYTLSKADSVIAVCQALKEAMIRLKIPEEKISVIPNGVDIGKFYAVQKDETRRKLGLPTDKKVILSVGHLIPLKGFDLLIKAFKILFEELHEKDLYLAIVGEGTSRRELERMISSLKLDRHVRLAGAIPHRELNLWYSAADLFCLASSREGWPNVLLESLACGTPVVATDVWGVPEIICSEQIGLLTKRSEREIAKTVSLALKKSWQSDAIIRYAREHTWEQVAVSVLTIFESVLESRSGSSPNYAVPK
ncbi:MAG: glycosyltransferase [Acidobacteria bacterium]|nr:MAG: glycosyltransferase [Acidobacteriota bacterium]